MRFYGGLNFKKNKKICMEIVAGEHLLNFFKIQTVIKSHFFNARDFKLGHYDVFDMLFSISGILKVAAHNFMKSRSRDGLAAKGLLEIEILVLCFQAATCISQMALLKNCCRFLF